MKVFTIGFAQKSAERFFSLLAQSGTRRILDVRLHNRSQLAGFAKQDDLAWFAKSLCDIDYAHLPALAPEREMLADYQKRGRDWPAYAARFLRLMKSRAIENSLSRQLLENACLLCSEHSPERCHRRLVLEYLQQSWGKFAVEHLS